jgi:hypothetical protein
MTGKKPLYTSADVREAIVDIFSTTRGRRVAISAFVGEGAEAFLPMPAGIELVCWPHPTGTNPDALRTLMGKGVRVWFADRVHMKVYWSEHRGAVVTSANLSTYAMGKGDLHEFGVRLRAEDINIDRVLSSLTKRHALPAELRRLDTLHDKYTMATREFQDRKKPRAVEFKQWYGLPSRKQWFLGWWQEEQVHQSRAIRDLVEAQYQIPTSHDFLQVEKNQVQKGKWVLVFKLDDQTAGQLRWMFVDHVVRVSPKDKVYNRPYPYEAVQVWAARHYPPAPFLIDAKFRAAFKSVVRKITPEGIMNLRSMLPAKRMIDEIYKHYITG